MFKYGDRVGHPRRGKGIFIKYEIEGKSDSSDGAFVEFDKDGDAKGETLCVTVVLLEKIDEE